MAKGEQEETRYVVYRIEDPDGTVRYEAFPESFFSSPWYEGSDFEATFLEPLEARKYYQQVDAIDDEAAIKEAKEQSADCWKWSEHNWYLSLTGA